MKLAIVLSVVALLICFTSFGRTLLGHAWGLNALSRLALEFAVYWTIALIVIWGAYFWLR
jgi:hypothetical protein